MKSRRHPSQGRLRLKDRRRRLMWIKMWAGGAMLALAVVVMWYVSRLPNFLITDVEVSGTSLVDGAEVESLSRDALEGTYGFVIPRANAFVAPRSEIRDAVHAKYPAIDSVKVTQRDPHTLLISISERKPAAVWCGGEGQCYFLDKDGFFYTGTTASDSFVTYAGGVTEAGVGATFPDFAALHDFIGATEETTGYAPVSVVVEENDDVSVTLTGGGVLKFVKLHEARATLDNIASVFASQSFQSGREFEYADFRYGNKVYVKFKGE